MTLLERRAAWKRLMASERSPDTRVALLSTFTVEPLVPYLGTALDGLQIVAEVGVGPYAQVVQQCVDPSSWTARWDADVLVVWPRLEDLWAGRALPLTDERDVYAADLLEMAEAAIQAAGGSTLVFVLPAIPEVRPLGVGDAASTRGVFAAATAAREGVRSRLDGQAGVLVVDAEEVVRELGARNAIDWRRLALARIPYQEAVYAEVADRIARVLHLGRRGAAKVVAVDADGTLWGGVVGEDGPEGIDLADNGPGEAFREFQRYLVELRRAGAVLAVVSKNEAADVWAAFDRPEMVLARHHVTSARVGWEEKPHSLRQIATELNLGTNAIVFIDDSAIERGKVETVLPEVQVLAMPEDPAGWFDAIARTGALDRLPPTRADRERSESYEHEAQRRELRARTTIDEFLASLDLHVGITAMAEGDVSRVSQLIAKTNQFTLDGVRRPAAEVASLLDAPERYLAAVVTASDRFGDYGTIGAFVIDLEPGGRVPAGGALLDTFVMSCRAMGRGVETAMLAGAFGLAGCVVWVDVAAGQRNQPAREFFARHGWIEDGGVAPLRAPAWPQHIVTPFADERDLAVLVADG